MKLSEREAKILAAIEHRADQPISVISKLTGFQEHSIRYYLSALREREILVGRAPFINMYPLGFTDYQIAFALASSNQQYREAVLQAIIKSPRVSWLGETGGERQYAIGLMVRYVDEVFEFFEGMAQTYGPLICNASISARRCFYAFGRRHLWPEGPNAPVLCYKRYDQEVIIDDKDHEILSALSTIPHQSNRELARITGIPHSTLERRVKALEEKKIISGFLYRFRFEKLQLHSYRLLISTRGVHPQLDQKIYDFCKQHPHVIHLFHCLGDWDFELGVEVHEPIHVSAIIQELQERFTAEMRSIKLLQLFRHLKYASYPGVRS